MYELKRTPVTVWYINCIIFDDNITKIVLMQQRLLGGSLFLAHSLCCCEVFLKRFYEKMKHYTAYYGALLRIMFAGGVISRISPGDIPDITPPVSLISRNTAWSCGTNRPMTRSVTNRPLNKGKYRLDRFKLAMS